MQRATTRSWFLVWCRFRRMSVKVDLLSRTGTRRTIRVTVTDKKTNAPLAGASVSVLDSQGGTKATGSTGAQGTVDLTYIGCTEVISRNGGKPIVVTVPCDGDVEKTGYQGTGFSTTV